MRKTFCLLAALLLAAGPAGASGDGAGKNRECAAGMNLMRNQWSGKRVAFLGDSITDERHVGTTKNYWQYLSEMLGIVPFVYGINGHQWSDVLGQARKLYAERGDAVDAVVVFAGTNDFNAGVPLGEWYEVREAECPMPGPSVGTRMRRTPSADTGTLCGRINAVLAFLKEHYPTKQVILLTPLHRGYARFSDRNVQPDESYPNRLGLYADAYVAKIREAGRPVKILNLFAYTGGATVACAAAGAQVVLISGYDGGTGAAPRTSIQNAGLPWELGIAETHQTLILNGLRTRVRIESDSKLLSGRDVAISCMLGAEEFGFGTTLLMAEGCVMMRVCNLDTCPMGICTQNPELRKNFKGKPEYIINYLTFVAEELREYMAKLGVRTVDELVGRTDLLRVKPAAPGSRAAELDLDCILHNPAIANSNVHFIKEDSYDFHLENTLDMKVLMKKFKLGSKAPQSVSLNVSNVDRAFGAIFGSEITRKYGNDLPDDVYTVHCTGAGGQSFGAFIPSGLTLELVGDCNDYMGKGLSGGKIVVRPPQGIDFKPEENIITGNVALYGATSGKAFISGVAGERFCVRNSGATAVVEGVGDHGCEYMTGGTVVVLGQTGKNFAAGMTGGIAYVLDENWDFYQRVNKETVSLEPVEHKYDVATLKELIREHVEETGSPRGKEILDNFSEFLPKFKKVLPYDYDRMLRVIASMEERGLDGDQAQIEAFYAVQKK